MEVISASENNKGRKEFMKMEGRGVAILSKVSREDLLRPVGRGPLQEP